LRLPPTSARWRLLSKAFADDPVMAYLMGEELSFDKGVKFFSLMTKIQVPQNHTYVTDKCEAAAVWAPPDKWKVPPLEIAKATPGFLSVFGAKRFVSALSALSVLEKAHPKEPHYYLEFLGTDPAHQRKGLGGAVLEPVLAKCDAEGLGAYLESSKDVNVPYYRHFGFEVRQEIEPQNNGPKQWLMWRDPAARTETWVKPASARPRWARRSRASRALDARAATGRDRVITIIEAPPAPATCADGRVVGLRVGEVEHRVTTPLAEVNASRVEANSRGRTGRRGQRDR
jgi:GNAT superfamily N-acetyltransferase